MPDRGATLTRIATTGMLLTAIACGRPAPSPAPAVPLKVQHAPGTARYRVVQRRHLEQTLHDQVAVTDVSTSAVFGVTVRAGTSGVTDLTVDVVVDTVRVSGFASEAGQDSAGIRLTSQIGPDGYLGVPETASDAGALVEQLARGVPNLVPPVPAQGIAPGQAWEDTTGLRVRSGGLPMTIRTQTVHRAGAWTTLDGVEVLEVTSRGSYHLTGEGERNGQWISLSGSGTSITTQWVTAGGSVQRGLRVDSLRVNVEVGGTGLTIPILQTEVDSVRRVR